MWVLYWQKAKNTYFTRVNIICLEYGWYMVVVVLFSQKKGKKCCWLFWLRVYERIYYVKIFAYITSENFFCIYRLPTFYLLPKHIFVRYFFNHVNPIWFIQFKNKSLGIFYSFCALEHIKKINILWSIFKYHSTFISRTKIDFSFLHFQSISMKGLSWTFIKIPVKYAFLGSTIFIEKKLSLFKIDCIVETR